MLIRDLCIYFPEAIYHPLQTYVPFLARMADRMNNASRLADIWVVMEALFIIFCNAKFRILQAKDPLEASLTAAPMYDPEDRKILWDRIIDAEREDPIAFITGWFFDESIESISRYDVCDFLCWCMFDGRNQEHLTTLELHELESFVEDLEYMISLQLYGIKVESDEGLCFPSTPNKENERESILPSNVLRENRIYSPRHNRHRMNSTDSQSFFSDGSSTFPVPNKNFRFPVDVDREEATFFSNIFESYKHRYDQYKAMLENSDFHPVQDFRSFISEKRQHAEESAMTTAHIMYETIVQPGSKMDKQLSALSQKTFDTANYLSQRREALMQQLKGNRALLTSMRETHHAVPSKQMAGLMQKITELYAALENAEHKAKEGFAQATGALASKGNSLFAKKEPRPYLRYSSDPLLGVKTYPLGFHLMVLGITESTLRVKLRNRGFERRCIGPLTYYYYPGVDGLSESNNGSKKLPIVYAHGIGIGLIYYMEFIDKLLELGRPIFLPEIPYVSGFRFWLGSHSVLSPTVVASTLTAMFASHGFSSGTFIGHSYGTSWLSYMCKFAPNAVAALLFLDPICFCLHYCKLTKNFVYHTPDPGVSSFMVRTDLMVNWTIQRAFPWNWIILFAEQIHVPCSVFLSDKDALVPVDRVLKYFSSKDIPMRNSDEVDKRYFDSSGDVNACVFRGHVHGSFVIYPQLMGPIIEACDSLCAKAEARESLSLFNKKY